MVSRDAEASDRLGGPLRLLALGLLAAGVLLSALAEGILFAARRVLGLSPTPDALAAWYFSNPRWVYLAARTWSLATAIGTLWVVSRLGARLPSPRAGLWAAVLPAISPLHIYYATIAKPDATVVLAMSAAGLLALRHAQERRAGLPWGRAVRGGLGATVKYPDGAAWLAEHGELVFTTHPGSRGLADWQEDPARLHRLEPRCGFAGNELQIYRVRSGGGGGPARG